MLARSPDRAPEAGSCKSRSPSSFAASADRVVGTLTARRDQWRLYGLAGALLLFGGGLYWAASSIGDIWSRLSIAHLALLLAIGAPVGMILNSIELYAMSRIAGGPIGWRRSLEVTVYTSAANMLPLPGGALAKVAALKAHGAGLGRGSAVLLLTYAVWGGLAFLYSAGALWYLGQTQLAAAFLAPALGFVAVCGAGAARYAAWRLVGVIALARLVSFPIEALRYLLAMAALGTSVAFAQGSVFVVASFIGSAVMLAPSGLGVGETVVALLAPLIKVDPAIGFIGAAVGRAAWMTGLMLTAVALLIVGLRPGAGHGRGQRGSA